MTRALQEDASAPGSPRAEDDARIDACTLCPRACGAVRTAHEGQGACRMGALPVVARAALHAWEEPCISGTRGSGTVFFSGCGLRCVFCQNAPISHGGVGRPITSRALAAIFRDLEAQGAHNINLVNPTHFVPQILAALRLYRPGVPIVYNSGGYEALATLRALAGWVDVYLPDFKFIDADWAARYAGAPDYPEHCQRALQAMCAQTGAPRYDADGLMTRGTLVRHLVLPGGAGQAMRILNWIAEHLPPGTPVSLMAQYTPCGEALHDPLLRRRVTHREYALAAAHLRALGLHAGYVQSRQGAQDTYIPPFDGTGVP